jgi:methyl-accepting chemotaxis protein
MSNKTLLIVERSENKLNLISEGEDKYVLEGTFTEIGVKNNNNRIYDEKEILPHVNELKKQCENNKLLGELDHPKSFDISLKNASHVIESIDYDPATKKVTGRIRLLNTDAGKNARALVDAGVPLHISSRAAGVVESNGHVKIKKMFTYDLVANPGFSNAELKRLNESYGFDAEDDNIGLFEVPDFWTFASNKIAENKENNIEPENKKINEMDAKKYISVEDFNEYTKIIKNEFENLKTSVQESSSNKEDKSLNEGLVKYAESIAKKVNSIQEHIGRLTENVDGLVSHNDYIIENLEKVKNYAELVGEKTNVGINYSEQLAESMDHLIEYTKMVAEKTNESINYTQYLGEKTSSLIDFSNYISEETSNRWGYQTHINEQLDKVISHNDYIVEGVDSVVKYSEYLKENTENLSNYLNFVVEQINEGASIEDIKKSTDIIVEKAKEVVQISETLEVDNNDDFKSDITNQLNAILESAKTEKETETDKKYHFFQFLGETKRREFDSLNAETQEKIVNAFQTNRYYGTADANKIWEGCFVQPTKRADWLLQMPSRYLASWNTLTESQKNSIKAQASTRLLESQYQIDNFWATRDLREVKVDLINENENLNAPIDESSEYKTPDTYMDAVKAGFRQRFKK